MTVGWMFVGSILFLGSIFDLKDLTVPTWLIKIGIVGGVLCMLLSGMERKLDWQELLPGMLPGCIFLSLSFLTREQIGYGDGLVLFILAGGIGGRKVFHIWLVGLLLSFLSSVVLIVARKAAKNTKIPFIPCLFGGYVIIGIMEVICV